ncbi:MAG: glycosyltransferase [Idiomarina sp.]|nr:glycosyltransferase [Idiomarina sp.]
MKFSILMSVYSKERACYLKECFDSLEHQSVKGSELVLVEDGPLSQDLHDVIDEYRLKLNIKSVVLQYNVGLATALNEGLKHCSFDLVARMDSDDIALPERFKYQTELMLDENVGVSSGVVEEWDEGFSRKLSVRRLPTSHHDIVQFSKSRCPISHPACIYRRNLVLSVGGYSDIYPEDHLLWIKLIQAGTIFANSKEPLLRMRTGREFFNRRGLRFLKGQIETFKHMRDTGFISHFHYYYMVLLFSILRLGPGWLKSIFYKLCR